MRLAAALLLCFVPMTGLAAPQPARAHVLQADRSDVSAPLTLLAATPAEEDEEEVEHGPGRVPPPKGAGGGPRPPEAPPPPPPGRRPPPRRSGRFAPPSRGRTEHRGRVHRRKPRALPLPRRLERPAEQFRRAGNAAGGAVRRGLLRDTERRLHSPGGRRRTGARLAPGPHDVPGGGSQPRQSGGGNPTIPARAKAPSASP